MRDILDLNTPLVDPSHVFDTQVSITDQLFFDDDIHYTMSNYRSLHVDNLYHIVSALAEIFHLLFRRD